MFTLKGAEWTLHIDKLSLLVHDLILEQPWILRVIQIARSLLLMPSVNKNPLQI